MRRIAPGKARCLSRGHGALARPRWSNSSIPPAAISIVSTPHHRFSSAASGRQKETSLPPLSSSTSWTQHPLSVSNVFPKMPQELKKVRRAYLGLGSNLGDRVQWIERACSELLKRGIDISRTSCLWETDPMYVTDQDKFLNAVCEITTKLEPLELLDTLQKIEQELGREKTIDKGPRNIDLDILLYENEVIDHERLKVPHPGIAEREFVLRPLAELIQAEPLHPSSPWKTVQDHLNALPPSPPMSTVCPLGRSKDLIRPLQPNKKTIIMAILNLTPDSFSDGGANASITGGDDPVDLNSLELTTKYITECGARIIDIGGQSSAPESVAVSDYEEHRRIVPSIALLRNTVGYNGLLSIDTFHASIASAAAEVGADIINDISAGQIDPKMLPTIARLGKTVCLMHMRGTPATMQKPQMKNYSPEGLIPTIAKELLQRVAEAQAAGIRRWRIILDPGIGFAKSGKDALEILRRFDELRNWPGLKGLPWLIGTSRKNFIGRITGVRKADERQYGTAATVTAAIQGGVDIVRVHDVRQMSQVAKMSDAIWRV